MHYETDSLHTFVMFEVRHFGTSTVRARFDRVSGTVELDTAAHTGSTDITIDAGSISSGIAEFDGHLRDERFLNAAKFPRARFVATRFQFDGDKVAGVTGELTLLGKAQPVALRATHFNCYDSPVHHAPVCGGDFETTIQRSRWGMNWGLDFGLPDDVRLLIQIEAIRK